LNLGILQPEELTAGLASFNFGNEMGRGAWLVFAWQFMPMTLAMFYVF